MCLAVPAQIVELMQNGLARCDLNGVKKEINVSLIDQPQVGDWIIVHVGFALHGHDESITNHPHRTNNRIAIEHLAISQS